MRRKFTNQDANRVSFPDCHITNFKAENDLITFNSDGIFIERDGFFWPNSLIECKIYGEIKLREYCDDKWNYLDIDKSRGLLEILEWKYENNSLTIAGFGSISGNWLEYSFDKCSIDIFV